MAKQLTIEGTLQAEHPEIDEIIEQLAEAKADQKRAAEDVKEAEALLVSRMLEAKVGRHDRAVGGKRYSAEIDLPEPSVKLRFLGEESE